MMKSTLLFVVLVLVQISLASHGRYGSISFTKSASNPRQVTLTFTVGYRITYFGCLTCYPVGSTFQDASLALGDGNYVTPKFTVTSVNTQDDWMTGVWTGDHIYPGAGDYTVNYASCCRIFALNNNPSYSYAFTALLHLTSAEVAKTTTVNNSPVSNMLPIINVPYGQVGYTYKVLANDPEGDALSFRMATAAEMGDGSSTQPTGLTVASDGTVTLGSVLATGYWSTQQVISDSFGNRMVIDYLLNVQTPTKYCNGTCQNSNAKQCTSNADCVSCNSACLTAVPRIVTNDLSSSSDPATNLPAPAINSVVYGVVGQTMTLSFVVDDENLYNPATPPYIFTSSVPSYATVTAQKACVSTNGCSYRGTFQSPQFIQVIITGTRADTTVVCVGARSLNNPLPYSQYCVGVEIDATPSTTGLNQICGDGVVQGTEQCDGSACCTSSCTFAASGSVCRASAGDCDVAETCSGSSDSCPADTLVAAGSTCRASAGDCDVAETCTGSSVSCPADTLVAAGSTCRASAGDCDVAETCTGSSAACPVDGFVAAGSTCRASAGVCDVAETCTGSAAACPVDAFLPPSTTCRSSAGVCDKAETCTGSSASCPADAFFTGSTVCRPAADACDIAETCTLGTAACPADGFNSTGNCASAAYVCPRLPNQGNGAANYWCSPFDTTRYYMCQTGAWAPASSKLKCPSGTYCLFPYGTDAGACGSPCASKTAC